MKIGNKNAEKIIRNTTNAYFMHLRNYCKEQNIKSPWKIQKVMKDMAGKTQLPLILENKEVASLKKDYEKGHIIRMFLKNKLKLMKGN